MRAVRIVAGVGREMAHSLAEYVEHQPDLTLACCVQDGIRLLQQIAQVDPDVVVLDLVLAQVDGLEVLARLPPSFGRPKVIVLSPYPEERMVTLVLSLGADYYLLKPVPAEVLGERIRQLTGSTTHAAFVVPPRAKYRHFTFPNGDITHLMKDMGIPANIKGYRYLRHAVAMVIKRPALLDGITTMLYPSLASEHGDSISCVERAIRHAIEVACTRGNKELVGKVFGSRRPANGAAIARLAEVAMHGLHTAS